MARGPQAAAFSTGGASRGGGKVLGRTCALAPVSAPFIFLSPAPCFPGRPRQIARHENRERDYLLDYLLLTPVGGAVSFTCYVLSPEEPAASASPTLRH